jgi:tripartite-type tricarboxylate transporter receptor subunit TctC
MKISSLIAFLLLFPGSVLAQSYPSKPIRFIVPAGAGSPVDVNARRVAPKLAEALGQPVIIDNRPGANSMIGAREAARAAPDGHTLFQAVVNNALNDLLTPDACCVLNDKLIAVTRLYSTPLVMVVHPSVPAANLKEYVAHARANPGKLTYASGGSGAITQLLGELVKATAGIQVRDVPYKAIGAEVPDLVGGHVSTGYLAPWAVGDLVKGGKLRGLAVAGPSRVSFLPDIPTMADAGYPGVEATGWNGIFVPAGTPAPVIQRLHQELARIMASKEIRDDAVTLGAQAGGERPEEFAAFVRSEIQKWGKVIKDTGIKIE